MSKTNADNVLKRTQQQVENTSAGGHLGGTYCGQLPTARLLP